MAMATRRHRPRPTGAMAMSMQNLASPAISFKPPKRNSLTHIPGDEGWPIIGKTLEVLADPKGHIEKHAAKYGLVYRSHLFGETSLVFLGPEANELTPPFSDRIAAAAAVIRKPLPGTQMARGVKGRKRIVAYFSEQIPIRREKGGEDLFSQLCRATHEDGALLSTQDIVDHMSFLMMAAHDTLTSSLTSFVAALAAHPHWQDRLRDEVTSLGLAPGDATPLDKLEPLPLSAMAFKEAMRLQPP